MGAPIGQLTRGTTGYNRLRRSDRWLVHSRRVRAALLSASDPLVVDLGYGALPVTTLEMAERLRMVRNDVRVIGLEIHPDRVRAARAAGNDAVEFGLGGFELAGRRPVLVRAFNVLRQYPVEAVADAWSTMQTPVGARRPDRRRHLRRTRPALLLGAARRERTAEPDTGLRPVRHRAPVRSRRATAEGADPSQHRGTTDPHAADRRRPCVGQRRRPWRLRSASALARDAGSAAHQRISGGAAAPAHARRRSHRAVD